ncbi:MAG: PA domain-containing protein [Geodermatophilaceae bacterium]
MLGVDRGAINVINFSIPGGTDPYADPVELAFLDAYAAGVFVAASAGNDGPGEGTVNHVSPWLTSAAASTQERAFESTLTVVGPTGTFTDSGASITDGAGPAPVVLASTAPYSDALCTEPAPEGLFAGKIVACERGEVARVEKGFNVLQGGAVGMILTTQPWPTFETDNHWLPTVHQADGTEFLAFMAANPNATATFTAGQKATRATSWPPSPRAVQGVTS